MGIQTGLSKYRDIDLSWIRHPVTGDLVAKTGDQAVIQSVKNLVNRNFYESPFHPEVGGGVRQLLFENVTPITAQRLKRAVEDVIKNFEPRVDLRKVYVQSLPDKNAFNVTIEFFIVNRADPTRVTVFLERL